MLLTAGTPGASPFCFASFSNAFTMSSRRTEDRVDGAAFDDEVADLAPERVAIERLDPIEKWPIDGRRFELQLRVFVKAREKSIRMTFQTGSNRMLPWFGSMLPTRFWNTFCRRSWKL